MEVENVRSYIPPGSPRDECLKTVAIALSSPFSPAFFLYVYFRLPSFSTVSLLTEVQRCCKRKKSIHPMQLYEMYAIISPESTMNTLLYKCYIFGTIQSLKQPPRTIEKDGILNIIIWMKVVLLHSTILLCLIFSSAYSPRPHFNVSPSLKNPLIWNAKHVDEGCPGYKQTGQVDMA